MILRPSLAAPGLPGRTTPLRQVAARAKVKGGGSGKGKSSLAGLLLKKKQAEETQQQGNTNAERASTCQYRSPEIRGLLFAIANSYHKATKKFLVDGVDLEQLPDAIFHAPFVCVAHDRFQEGVTDPAFTYANKAGLELWEGTWDQIVGMPSRLSAVDDPEVQQNRQALLDQAATSKTGVVMNYEGLRQSLSGRQFRIKGVTLFNVIDFSGEKIGQCAVFDQYQTEDGTVVKVRATGEGWKAPEIELPPSEADIQAAEAAVEAQAGVVRTLKEGPPALGNQDPQVQAAVAELKARKEAVVTMKKKMEETLKAAMAAFDEEEEVGEAAEGEEE